MLTWAPKTPLRGRPDLQADPEQLGVTQMCSAWRSTAGPAGQGCGELSPARLPPAQGPPGLGLAGLTPAHSAAPAVADSLPRFPAWALQ